MKENLTKLETVLDLYFNQKAPKLPENIKEIIVKFAPYLSLIAVVFSIPTVLFALGINAMLSPFAAYYGGYHMGTTFTISGIFLLASLVLEALAIPGLFKHSKSGWNFMFYASLVNLVQQLVSFNLIPMIIGGVISMYFLFQVKSYYK